MCTTSSIVKKLQNSVNRDNAQIKFLVLFFSGIPERFCAVDVVFLKCHFENPFRTLACGGKYESDGKTCL